MILLIPIPQGSCITFLATNLNSIMILLIHMLDSSKADELIDLNSIMILLILNAKKTEDITLKKFKFHYDSINSKTEATQD